MGWREVEQGRLMRVFLRFLKNENGVTAIEYALISAIISVTLVATFITIGSRLSNMMAPIGNDLN